MAWHLHRGSGVAFGHGIARGATVMPPTAVTVVYVPLQPPIVLEGVSVDAWAISRDNPEATAAT
jgi:hypothetical protein